MLVNCIRESTIQEAEEMISVCLGKHFKIIYKKEKKKAHNFFSNSLRV